jgi:hypothetical protein
MPNNIIKKGPIPESAKSTASSKDRSEDHSDAVLRSILNELKALRKDNKDADAKLFLNGEERGKPLTDPKNLFLYWDIPFAEGILKAESFSCSDYLKTSTGAVALFLDSDKETLNSEGLDIAHIEVKALDNAGEADCTCEYMVKASAAGPGVILGVDNGSLWDAEDLSSHSKRLKEGRMIIYVASSGGKGLIKLKVQANRLKSKEIEIKSI